MLPATPKYLISIDLNYSPTFPDKRDCQIFDTKEIVGGLLDYLTVPWGGERECK